MSDPDINIISDSGLGAYSITSKTIELSGWPKPTWRWDMFGGQQMVVTMTDACPEPSRFQRLMTRLLFGSKWERL